jgi:putative ABC transport system substrate-binding protein
LEVDEKRLQLLLEAVPTISRVAIGVDPVIGLAEQYRLPAIHPTRNFAERGGLMAYEPRLSEMYRRAAEFVDRILRGASPADFPIELPTRYDLVANMRTARSLGLTLSRDFLARVDELIE